MLRVHYSHYGAPDVLELVRAEIPAPRAGEVLVRMVASSINAIDWKNRQGRFRLVSGPWRPRTRQGFDVAGIVHAAGQDTQYQPGQRVFGLLGNLQGGAFSEYVSLPARQIQKAPDNVDWHQIAGLPMAAVTAWQALFENGRLASGQRVLINGGSSGVGHYAIQIAKAYGAEVAAVCSAENATLCLDMGADTVIDYQKHDFVYGTGKYDIVFDVVNNRSLSQVAGILKADGIYIGTTPTPRLIWSVLTTRRARFVAVRPNPDALQDIRRLGEAGLLKTHIDRVFPITEIARAHAYAEKKRTRGKVIIAIADA